MLLRYALGLFNCGAVGFNELYQAKEKDVRFTCTAPDSDSDLELLYAQGRRVAKASGHVHASRSNNGQESLCRAVLTLLLTFGDYVSIGW